jgi:hypothetical protein
VIREERWYRRPRNLPRGFVAAPPVAEASALMQDVRAAMERRAERRQEQARQVRQALAMPVEPPPSEPAWNALVQNLVARHGRAAVRELLRRHAPGCGLPATKEKKK